MSLDENIQNYTRNYVLKYIIYPIDQLDSSWKIRKNKNLLGTLIVNATRNEESCTLLDFFFPIRIYSATLYTYQYQQIFLFTFYNTYGTISNQVPSTQSYVQESRIRIAIPFSAYCIPLIFLLQRINTYRDTSTYIRTSEHYIGKEKPSNYNATNVLDDKNRCGKQNDTNVACGTCAENGVRTKVEGKKEGD